MTRALELVPTHLSPSIPLPPSSQTPASVTPEDKFVPSSWQLIYLFFFLENSYSHSTSPTLPHFSIFNKYHFLRKWYPNPKYDPLIHVSKAPKSFPLHPSCSVMTHWIVFPPLIPPSPLNYKQYRDHICLLFTFCLVPNTQQYTTNVFKQMRKWDIGTV